MIRNDFPHLGKVFGFRGTHYVHHPLGRGPLSGRFEHFPIQRLSAGQGSELEIASAGVGGQGEQHDPLALELQERSYRVAPHVRSYGYRIEIHRLEKCPGVQGGSIADVGALGVGDGQHVRVVGTEIGDGLFQSLPSGRSARFEEGGIGLVGHAVGCSGVDDGAAEVEQGLLRFLQTSGEFAHVRVQSYAQETLFPADLCKKFVVCHVFRFLSDFVTFIPPWR